MTLEQALHELGVRDDTLTAIEKAQLDTEGYVLLPEVLSAEEVSGVRAALEELSLIHI